MSLLDCVSAASGRFNCFITRAAAIATRTYQRDTKPGRSKFLFLLKRPSAANQIDDQHDDCYDQQQMDQRAADMADETKQPEYE